MYGDQSGEFVFENNSELQRPAEELAINIIYMIKISSKQVKQFFYLDRNDHNERKKKLGDHKLDDYDRQPLSNQTFNFV